MDENVTANIAGVIVNSLYVNNSPCGWILDSGATDRMISNLNMLFDLKDVSNDKVLVNLPNGNYVPAKYIGKYFLTPELIFKKVLYVPDFKFNLLSVSKLTADNNCVVKFLIILV